MKNNREIQKLIDESYELLAQGWQKVNTELDKRAREYEAEQQADFLTAQLPF